MSGPRTVLLQDLDVFESSTLALWDSCLRTYMHGTDRHGRPTGEASTAAKDKSTPRGMTRITQHSPSSLHRRRELFEGGSTKKIEANREQRKTGKYYPQQSQGWMRDKKNKAAARQSHAGPQKVPPEGEEKGRGCKPDSAQQRWKEAASSRFVR